MVVQFFEWFFLLRQMRLSADLNNMTWRIRPEELLLEVGRPFSSKMNLEQALTEVIGFTFLFNVRLSFHVYYVADISSVIRRQVLEK